MCEVEGEGVVREYLAQRWFQRFNTGEESTIGNQDIKLLPEKQNYGILKMYAEVWKKIHKKVLIGCQKNLLHQRIPYIARLRHLENDTEAVDLYLMN